MTPGGPERVPVLRLVYPDLPPREYSPNSRVHWTVKSRVSNLVWHDMTGLMLEQGWEIGRKVDRGRVRFRFGLPDKRRRDLDNLIGASKPLLDCLPLSDDNVRRFTVEYDWFDSPRDPKTIIEVYEFED